MIGALREASGAPSATSPDTRAINGLPLSFSWDLGDDAYRRPKSMALRDAVDSAAAPAICFEHTGPHKMRDGPHTLPPRAPSRSVCSAPPRLEPWVTENTSTRVISSKNAPATLRQSTETRSVRRTRLPVMCDKLTSMM